MQMPPPAVESTSPSRLRARIVVVMFTAIGGPAAVSLLYNFSPTDNAFYPGCLFNWLTGLHCPGCGATRCCYALLPGDVAQAFAWNPLFLLLLPLMGLVCMRLAYSIWTGDNVKRFRIPGWFTWLLLSVLLAYWIARNLPIYPFTLMAPHSLV